MIDSRLIDKRDNGGTGFVDVPEDAKTDLQISNMVQDFYLESSQADDKYFAEMQKHFKYVEGDQWSEIKNADGTLVKTLLEAEGKPALTKNRLHAMVQLLCGVESQEPLEPRIIGRTAEDRPIAEGMNECVKWVWDSTKGQRKFSTAFRRMISSGRGWIAIEQVDDEADIFGTKTKIPAIHPREMLIDPKGEEYDLSDVDYLLRIRTYTRSEIRALWPEKEKEIKEYFGFLDMSINRQNIGNKTADMMRRYVDLVETWYRVYVPVQFILNGMTGKIKMIDKGIPQEDIQAIIQQNPYLKPIKKNIKLMKYARTCGAVRGITLEYGDSPYRDNYYPYVPLFGYRSDSGECPDYGIVKNLIDPQNEINKRDSQILHYINKLPRTKVITDDDKLSNAFEQSQDIVTITPNKKFTIIPPPAMPEAYARLVEHNDQDTKIISGINSDLMATPERQQNVPGITLNLRQKQGMLITAPLFDNASDARELATLIIVSRIQQYMSPGQVARILGPEKADPRVIEAILSREVSEFDLKIIQSPSSPTIRSENFAKLIEMHKNIMPIPPNIIAEASDIPQKDELVELYKQAMQPQPQPGVPPLPGANSAAPPLPGQ